MPELRSGDQVGGRSKGLLEGVVAVWGVTGGGMLAEGRWRRLGRTNRTGGRGVNSACGGLENGWSGWTAREGDGGNSGKEAEGVLEW